MVESIDRRNFLKLGAASAGAAIGCGGADVEGGSEAAPGRMRYRPLGSTGIEVSEVSFGAHGVESTYTVLPGYSLVRATFGSVPREYDQEPDSDVAFDRRFHRYYWVRWGEAD